MLLTPGLYSAVKNDVGPIASKLAHFLFSVIKYVPPPSVFNLGGRKNGRNTVPPFQFSMSFLKKNANENNCKKT